MHVQVVIIELGEVRFLSTLNELVIDLYTERLVLSRLTEATVKVVPKAADGGPNCYLNGDKVSGYFISEFESSVPHSVTQSHMLQNFPLT